MVTVGGGPAVTEGLRWDYRVRNTDSGHPGDVAFNNLRTGNVLRGRVRPECTMLAGCDHSAS